MPLQRLREYLDEHHVHYELIPHQAKYTSQETAAAAHVPGKELAKTVIVSVDGKWAMVVLPAHERIDLDRLRRVTGAGEVRLASEDDFRMLFEDCELGAMPPFGNLYGMPVFVDQHLREDERIAFNAGTHDELMRVAYVDFERLVKPVAVPVHAD